MKHHSTDNSIEEALRKFDAGIPTEEIMSAHKAHNEELLELFGVIRKLEEETPTISPSPATLQNILHTIEIRNKQSWSWLTFAMPIGALAVIALFVFIHPQGVIVQNSGSEVAVKEPTTLKETARVIEDMNLYVEKAQYPSESDVSLASFNPSDDNLATLYDSTL